MHALGWKAVPTPHVDVLLWLRGILSVATMAAARMTGPRALACIVLLLLCVVPVQGDAHAAGGRLRVPRRLLEGPTDTVVGWAQVAPGAKGTAAGLHGVVAIGLWHRYTHAHHALLTQQTPYLAGAIVPTVFFLFQHRITCF